MLGSQNQLAAPESSFEFGPSDPGELLKKPDQNSEGDGSSGIGCGVESLLQPSMGVSGVSKTIGLSVERNLCQISGHGPQHQVLLFLRG